MWRWFFSQMKKKTGAMAIINPRRGFSGIVNLEALASPEFQVDVNFSYFPERPVHILIIRPWMLCQTKWLANSMVTLGVYMCLNKCLGWETKLKSEPMWPNLVAHTWVCKRKWANLIYDKLIRSIKHVQKGSPHALPSADCIFSKHVYSRAILL